MSSFNELFSSSRFDSEMAAEEGEEQQQVVVVGTHRDLGQTVETMLNLFVSNHYDRSQFFLIASQESIELHDNTVYGLKIDRS